MHATPNIWSLKHKKTSEFNAFTLQGWVATSFVLAHVVTGFPSSVFYDPGQAVQIALAFPPSPAQKKKLTSVSTGHTPKVCGLCSSSASLSIYGAAAILSLVTALFVQNIRILKTKDTVDSDETQAETMTGKPSVEKV
ncbi:hypothetical protein C8R43DRAFT_945272 [Mycena crocata]|nr:hypothetical protein C8R43DRAFT_945272 [Mycena crocata]